MKKLCHETGVTTEGDDVRVLVGSRGSTTRLLMPHQYRCLFARGPLAGNWHEELASSLSRCGAILKQETKPFPKERFLWVTFHDPKDAEKANKLDCPVGVTLQPQLLKKEDGLNTSSLSIKLEWNRRERKNFINIDFRSPLYVPSVISQLSNGNVAIAGNLLRFRPSKHNHCHVYVTNVHPQIPEEAIRNEFRRILTPLGYVRGSYDIIFAYTQKFETSEEDLEELQVRLKSLLTPSVPEDCYNLRLLRPEPFHKFFAAYVNFFNIDEGMTALDSLNNARINYKPIRVTRSLSSSIKYSTALYTAIEKSLEEASKSVKAKYQSVKVTILTKSYKVLKVESDTPGEYVAALKELNSVLKPEIIDCSSQLYYEYMRSKKCEEDISRIETTTLTVIKRDFRLKSIKLYGTKENTQQARTEFDKLLSFGNEPIKYYEVSLKQSGRPPGLLKYLITTFGIDLSLLITQPGIKMVRIDLRNHQLIVFASDAGYQVLVAIIDQFCQENATKPQTDPAHTAEVECCACYTPIDNTDNVYRLEYCGHVYHYECIETQLSPNTITIPILCAADNCSEPFVWQDFENLKTKGILDPRDVITESVRAYLATNQECVHNCPTPDCDMVYAVTEERSCFLCSHCGVLTCTKCHKVYHSGLTCEQNESAGSADEDLRKWLEEDTANRKLCPKCNIGIEKFEGCAHVHCMQCKSHICWHCMAFFGSSGECYGHLSSTHGGFV